MYKIVSLGLGLAMLLSVAASGPVGVRASFTRVDDKVRGLCSGTAPNGYTVKWSYQAEDETWIVWKSGQEMVEGGRYLIQGDEWGYYPPALYTQTCRLERRDGVVVRIHTARTR